MPSSMSNTYFRRFSDLSLDFSYMEEEEKRYTPGRRQRRNARRGGGIICGISSLWLSPGAEKINQSKRLISLSHGPQVNSPLFQIGYMSIKVTCTKIHLNQSNPLLEYFGYTRSSHDPAFLVSPLVVAGIVIGLVLFLSCVTIIIGSLRKDGGERDWHLENPSYDGISYATSSFGDLRSVCTGDLSPAVEFGSYLELSASYPDYPPCYEDCVGPGTLEIDLPADNPPPYSLEDPHVRQVLSLSYSTEEMPLSSQINTEDFQVFSYMSTVGLQVVSPIQTMAKGSFPIIPIDIPKDISLPGIFVSEENLTWQYP